VAAFARESDVVYHRLLYWVSQRREAADDGDGPFFMEQQVPRIPSANGDEMVLRCERRTNGLSAEVRMSSAVSASFVAQVLREVLR
jgi:hypothetical protein